MTTQPIQRLLCRLTFVLSIFGTYAISLAPGNGYAQTSQNAATKPVDDGNPYKADKAILLAGQEKIKEMGKKGVPILKTATPAQLEIDNTKKTDDGLSIQVKGNGVIAWLEALAKVDGGLGWCNNCSWPVSEQDVLYNIGDGPVKIGDVVLNKGECAEWRNNKFTKLDLKIASAPNADNNKPGAIDVDKQKLQPITDIKARYTWKSSEKLPLNMAADGITVNNVSKDGKVYQGVGTAKGGKGTIPFLGDKLVIDLPGSRDVHIEIDKDYKRTDYAGLTFTSPCVLAILEDGTLMGDIEHIVAKDKDGRLWVSRQVNLEGKPVIAFFHNASDVGALRSSPDPKAPSSGQERQPVKLIVRLPADAKLELEGQEVQTKGESRQFQIPPIPTDTDSRYRLTASWKENGEQRTVSRTLSIRGGQKVETDLRRPLGWPASSGELAGNQEVRVKNPNDFTVTVGLRSQGRGKDFAVPANSTKSVYVPNGRCEIYFQYSTDPDGLYQGDNFTLANNGVEIQIVKVVNGNYGIRKVN